jgi:hypothetical protein
MKRKQLGHSAKQQAWTLQNLSMSEKIKLNGKKIKHF